MAQETSTVANGPLISEAIEGASIVFCVPPDQLVVSEDKLHNVLNEYKDSLQAKDGWVAPAGIGVTLLLTFATADFRDFLGISGASWKGFFLLAIVLDLIWALRTLIVRGGSMTIAEIVTALKAGGKTRSMIPVAHAEEMASGSPAWSQMGGVTILSSAPQCMRCGFTLPNSPPGSHIICPKCRTMN